jgi:hypothetical protein
VKEFLSGKGVITASALASSVLVRDQIDGVERLVVEAQMATGGDLVKAQGGAASAQGDWKPRLETRLVVRERAHVRIRLRASGSGGATIDLPAIPARPLPLRSRPRGGPAAARRKTSICPRSTPTTARWRTPTTT